MCIVRQSNVKFPVRQSAMPLLALDTSTGPASIALIGDDGSVLATHEDSEALKQSQRLVSSVDALVREHLGGYDSLSCMVVGHGPGGFTGIRIGLATARGLALAADIPLIGISTLESYAWQALGTAPLGTQAIAMVDAYRGQAYCQPFRRVESGLKAIAEAEAIDYSSLEDYAAKWQDAVKIGNPKIFVSDLTYIAMPLARFSAELVTFSMQHQSLESLAESHPAEAFYIRPPDAKPQKPFLK